MREKKNRWKNLVLGMVLMALLMALAMPALATTGSKQLEVDYMDIHLHVDGIPVPLSSKPFVCEGTTYLPVRAVGEALGKDVRWDGPTHTIYITDPAEPNALTDGSSYGSTGKKTIEVDYLDIKLVVDGKEVTPKDANGKVVEPFAYQGTTYLPVRAVGEALGKTVRWDGETKTVYLGELPQATYLVDVCKVSGGYLCRAADHSSFRFDGKWYSQGFWVPHKLTDSIPAEVFELGGKYESLTFDYLNTADAAYFDGEWLNDRNAYGVSKRLYIYLDGELAQTIEGIEGGGVQTVTVPLNYAQTIGFATVDDDYYGKIEYAGIANAVLHGERAVTKPVPPENATYLVDVCTVNGGKAFKAAEEEYKTDIFGNKYTNGFCVWMYGSDCVNVNLNGKYKTLKATVVNTYNSNDGLGSEGSPTRYIGEQYIEKDKCIFYVDGEVVEEIELSIAMGPQTIEIPLNYGLELKFSSNYDVSLVDAILE